MAPPIANISTAKMRAPRTHRRRALFLLCNITSLKNLRTDRGRRSYPRFPFDLKNSKDCTPGLPSCTLVEPCSIWVAPNGLRSAPGTARNCLTFQCHQSQRQLTPGKSRYRTCDRHGPQAGFEELETAMGGATGILDEFSAHAIRPKFSLTLYSSLV